jgi:hypothetical protein
MEQSLLLLFASLSSKDFGTKAFETLGFIVNDAEHSVLEYLVIFYEILAMHFEDCF